MMDFEKGFSILLIKVNIPSISDIDFCTQLQALIKYAIQNVSQIISGVYVIMAPLYPEVRIKTNPIKPPKTQKQSPF